MLGGPRPGPGRAWPQTAPWPDTGNSGKGWGSWSPEGGGTTGSGKRLRQRMRWLGACGLLGDGDFPDTAPSASSLQCPGRPVAHTLVFRPLSEK